MSQIHYRDVTLEQLLERAHIALVVRLTEPGHRSEHIPFRSSTWNGQSAPDFVRSFTRLEVIEVLSKNSRVRVGDVIEVESADAGARQRMHEDYYRKGLSRSPIFEHFKGVTLDATPCIALIQESGDHLHWVVDTSTLSISERSRLGE